MAAHDGNTAVVRAAAVSGHRTHLVLVVPFLFAGDGVNGIHMVVRRGQVHRAINNDRRSFHGLQHFRLESECRAQGSYVGCVDLFGGVVTAIGVICIGMQKIVAVFVSTCQLCLADFRLGEPSCQNTDCDASDGLGNFLTKFMHLCSFSLAAMFDKPERKDGDDFCFNPCPEVWGFDLG